MADISSSDLLALSRHLADVDYYEDDIKKHLTIVQNKYNKLEYTIQHIKDILSKYAISKLSDTEFSIRIKET
jgi:hypothetical protein